MARAAQRTILRRVSEGKLVIDKKGRAVAKKPEVKPEALKEEVKLETPEVVEEKVEVVEPEVVAEEKPKPVVKQEPKKKETSSRSSRRRSYKRSSSSKDS